MRSDDLVIHTDWEDMPMFYNDNDRELMGAPTFNLDPYAQGTTDDDWEGVLEALEDFDDSSLDGEFGAEDLSDFEEMGFGFSLKKTFRKAKRRVKKELKPKRLLKRATGYNKAAQALRDIKKPKRFIKRQFSKKNVLKHATGIRFTPHSDKLVKGAKYVARHNKQVRKAIHVGGKVGTNKYVVAGAGAVSLAFPPAAPAAGAVVAAGRALKAADGMLGTPAAQRAARLAIKATIGKAAKGDRSARRMVGVMSKVAKARKVAQKKGRLTKGILVMPGGKIKRGSWRGA